jgi:single-stranded DNA-binding protein
LINEVVIEGIVVRDPWKFMEDLFFRLVVYRDSDQPSKKLDQERDAGDYINVRVSGGANGLIHIHRGMRLRVHGFLQSRDYRESLEEFVSKARRAKSFGELAIEIKGGDFKPGQVQIDRNVVEVVAKRIIVQERPPSLVRGGSDAASQSEKKPKSADKKGQTGNADIEGDFTEAASIAGSQGLSTD